MKKIIHLSDLHFGRTDEAVVPVLLEAIEDIHPDLVVISGDLTQRAKKSEFESAQAFIKAIPYRTLVVPGNHDIPLYNVFSRFFRSLGRYKKYIRKNTEPFYEDDDVCIVCVNTARSHSVVNGNISAKQIKSIRQKIAHVPDDVVKILVSHHPFDFGHVDMWRKPVRGAKKAMPELAALSIDIFLAGHFHRSYVGTSAKRYNISGHSALVVQAGTAASTRQRGETYSFNALYVDSGKVLIEHYDWQADQNAFGLRTKQSFIRNGKGLIAEKVVPKA